MCDRIREKDAATYLGIRRVTLRAMRVRGEKTGRVPIPFYRMGLLAYYDKADLDEYLRKTRVEASE